jgi:lactate permease
MSDVVYNCVDPDGGVRCAESCVSLDACSDCNCAFLDLGDTGGPWGDFMDVFFCLLPIIVLIITVTVPKFMLPTTVSLPLAAFLMFLVRLAYLGSDPLLTTASVILGLLEALTPLSIMAGAICLFETMESTLCLPFMMREIEALTEGHPIAELMLIFAFAYLVEGASGFGTPAALSAPMLVRRHYPAVESVVVVLIFNTFATVWGAVGTPLWFGFQSLEDGISSATFDELLLTISSKAAVALAASALVLMPLILTILVPWQHVLSNILFVYLSLLSTIGPSVALAHINYEFPSLIGGIVGCLLSAILVKYKVGMTHVDHSVAEEQEISFTPNPEAAEDTGNDGVEVTGTDNGGPKGTETESASPENGEGLHCEKTKKLIQRQLSRREETASFHDSLGPRKTYQEGYLTDVFLRTFPLWGVVLLLIATRVEQIGIKEHLISTEKYFSIHFGTLGTFRLSTSVVFEFRDIMTYPNLNWNYELFYVPFILPFILISLLTMLLFRKDMTSRPRDIAFVVLDRLKNPAIALFGALVLVQLMIQMEEVAPAFILGTVLSDWFQEAFVVISPLLGALGSFFSGSTTVSNLTFGSIQRIAAESIGTSSTTMLALQAVGGSAGNGICLNNIISACAVVGLNIGEGQLLLRTYKYVFATTTISTAIMLAFFFRF